MKKHESQIYVLFFSLLPLKNRYFLPKRWNKRKKKEGKTEKEKIKRQKRRGKERKEIEER